MSEPAAVSVKNLRSLFENTTLQEQQRGAENTVHRQETPSKAEKSPSATEPAVASHSPQKEDRAPSHDMQPGATMHDTDVLETHPLSSLDFDGETLMPEAAGDQRQALVEPETDHALPRVTREPSCSDASHEREMETRSSASLTPTGSIAKVAPPRPPRPISTLKPQAVKSIETGPLDLPTSAPIDDKPAPNDPFLSSSASTGSKSVPPQLPARHGAKDPHPASFESKQGQMEPQVAESASLPLPRRRRAPPKPEKKSNTCVLPPYEALVQKVSLQQDSGPVVRAGAVKILWNRSGLAAKDLSSIWGTVTDNDPTCSFLTKDQFITGMRMVDERRQDAAARPTMRASAPLAVPLR
ncbi:hypothetical protein MNAN1_000080 [Malassezia nana]|uniref:EH domain-containing protein n=1 Tax=Malassezia nana TaxID=180528 RepID=A0AAF0J0T5_9BASI|nr:hypothetical protein MNAN1_000080 [Malassezia nana]